MRRLSIFLACVLALGGSFLVADDAEAGCRRGRGILSRLAERRAERRESRGGLLARRSVTIRASSTTYAAPMRGGSCASGQCR